jgi:hypothetical protein
MRFGVVEYVIKDSKVHQELDFVPWILPLLTRTGLTIEKTTADLKE